MRGMQAATDRVKHVLHTAVEVGLLHTAVEGGLLHTAVEGGLLEREERGSGTERRDKRRGYFIALQAHHVICCNCSPTSSP